MAFVAGTFVLTDSIDGTFDDLFAQADARAPTSRCAGPRRRLGRRQRRGPRSRCRSTWSRRPRRGRRRRPRGRRRQGNAGPGRQGRHAGPLRRRADLRLRDHATATPTLTLVEGPGPGGPDRGRGGVQDAGAAPGSRSATGPAPCSAPSREDVTIVGESVRRRRAGRRDRRARSTSARPQQYVRPGRHGLGSSASPPSPGSARTQLRDRVAAGRSGAAPRRSTGKAVTDEHQDEPRQVFLDFITIFLLVFAGIALFVGIFIIANTFSMLVAQRTRELGAAAGRRRLPRPGAAGGARRGGGGRRWSGRSLGLLLGSGDRRGAAGAGRPDRAGDLGRVTAGACRAPSIVSLAGRHVVTLVVRGAAGPPGLPDRPGRGDARGPVASPQRGPALARRSSAPWPWRWARWPLGFGGDGATRRLAAGRARRGAGPDRCADGRPGPDPAGGPVLALAVRAAPRVVGPAGPAERAAQPAPDRDHGERADDRPGPDRRRRR